MKYHLFFLSLITYCFSNTGLHAQNMLRNVEQLTVDSSGWPIVKEWIKTSKNKVELLAADHNKASQALMQLQVTTRSPMGAIIYFTGGILVDNGWIRILGSGNSRLTRSLPEWNKGKSFKDYGEHPEFLLVADDVVGGYFAVNGGTLGNDPGMVYYFAPNSLNWEPLHLNYSDFINFCFNGDIDKFYSNVRWKGWKNDLAKISADQVFSFYPYLWTAEGKNIDTNVRNIVPTQEQYIFNIDARIQLGKNE